MTDSQHLPRRNHDQSFPHQRGPASGREDATERLTRRAMIAGIGGMAVAAMAPDAPAANPVQADRNGLEPPSIAIFTKPLQSLDFDQLASTVADLGAQGVEATVRPGGHVEPDRVEEDLPRLVEALRARKLEVLLMATNINRADDAVNLRVMKTASRLGIRRYRMGYLHYRLDSAIPLHDQLLSYRMQIRDLAAANAELNLTAVYQNHAGPRYIGAGLWDMYRLLEGTEPDQVGFAYDIRHATVEGGTTWTTTLQLIRSRLQSVFVKDFVWDGPKPRNVPLGQGRVNPTFAEQLKRYRFNGPYSLHMEYFDHRDPSLTQQSIAALRNDMAVLKKWLNPVS